MTGPGEALRKARNADGYTLEDAERETRIAQRYLIALEEEDTAALPAPVYTRGFLRAYARLLGLDPEAILKQFPLANRTDPASASALIFPEPPPTRLNRRLASIAIGLATVAILTTTAVYGLAATGDTTAPTTSQEAGQQPSDSGQGRIIPISGPESSATPRTVDAPGSGVARTGDMPDFLGIDRAAALAQLKDMGVPYLVVETYSEKVQAGKVLQQTPRPGVPLDSKTSITLVVSKGATLSSPIATATPR